MDQNRESDKSDDFIAGVYERVNGTVKLLHISLEQLFEAEKELQILKSEVDDIRKLLEAYVRLVWATEKNRACPSSDYRELVKQKLLAEGVESWHSPIGDMEVRLA